MADHDQLPIGIARALDRFRRRRRLYQGLRALVLLAAVYLTLVLAVAHLDRFAFLDLATRQTLSWIVNASAAATAAVLAVRFVLRRVDARQIAYELEARVGSGAGERFVTIESLYREGVPSGDAAMIAQLRAEGETLAKDLDSAALVRDPHLVRRCWVLAAIAVVMLVLWLIPGYQFPLMLERFAFPGRNLPKPSFITLSVDPAAAVVGRGGEVVIQVGVDGRIPAILSGVLGWLGADSGTCLMAVAATDADARFDRGEVVALSRIQRDLFLATRGDLEEGFSFRVRCGDAETAIHRVAVVSQPVITGAALVVEHPAYTGLGGETFTDLTSPIALLPGSKVELRFGIDQEDAAAALVLPGANEPLALERGEDGLARYPFEVAEAVVLEPRATNAAGFTNVDRLRVRVGLREDRKPSLRLTSPGNVVDLLPGELVPIQLAAEDDFGLAAAAVQYRINPHLNDDAPIEEQPLATWEGELSAEFGGSFDLGGIAVSPGDEVVLQLRVRDSAGNDGMSHPVLLRVVALTRGEHERRRIQALALALRGLDAAVPRDGALVVPSDVSESLLEEASAAGIGLDAPGGVAEILSLIEREHHLSSKAADQRGLRSLGGALLLARAADAASLEQLRSGLERLDRILRYRRVANAVWRLHGMRAEALRIRTVLAELVELEAPSEDVVRALRRRTALYLQVLQDVGDEILAAAEIVPGLEVEQIKGTQGDLNTAAYYLKRGSVRKNLASADDVLAKLDEMIAMVVPSLTPLAIEAADARRQLAEADLARAIAVLAGDAGRALGWFSWNLEVMDREPLSALWPRVEAYLAAEALRAGEQRPDLSALRQSLADAIAADRVAARTLERDVALADIDREIDDPAERRLAIRLVDLEYHMALGGDGSDDTLAMSTELDHQRPDPAIAAVRASVKAIAEQVTVASADAATQAAVAAVRIAAEDYRALAAAAERGQPPAPSGRAQVDASLGSAELAVDDATRAVTLRLSELDPFAESAPADEVLLLKIRRSQERYRSRSARARVTLEASIEAEGAAEIRELAQAAAAMDQSLTALADQLADHADGHRDGSFLSADERDRLPRLEEYAETDRLLLIAGAVQGAGDGAADMVAGFLSGMPSAAARYLLGERSHIDRTAAALLAAGRALDLAALDLHAFSEARSTAQREIRAFGVAVERSGSAALDEAYRGPIEAIANRIESLALAAGSSDEDVRRAIYGLGEAQRELERISRRLDALGQVDAPPSSQWRGGPDGLWGDETLRRDAEARREQIAALAGLCRDRAIRGAVAAISGKADPAAERWARTLHRLVRSPLSGQAAERTTGGDEAGGDPLIRWLTDEARDGLKRDDLRTYPAVTKAYLESLLDLLRY